MCTHIPHRQQPPIKEKDNTQKGEQEAKGCQAQSYLCRSHVHTWQLRQLLHTLRSTVVLC